MQWIRTLLAAAPIAAATLVGLTTTAAEAAPATIVVDTTADTIANDGVTSLREALASAQFDGMANTVQLAAGPGTVYQLTNCTGTGGELHYQSDESLTIDGNGNEVLQMCADERVMNLSTPNAPVILQELTITGGSLDDLDGAGIWVNAPLTIMDSRFQDNHTTDGDGGAVRSMKAALVYDTVFTFNSGENGGAISTNANITISGSAIVDNDGELSGGISVNGSTSLTNSTVSDNVASAHITGGIATTDLFLRHTTVARNQGTGALATQIYALGNLTAARSAITDGGLGTRDCTVAGSRISQGWNLTGDNTCGLAAAGDQPSAGDIGLDAAADNGGNTLTALPDEDSPLIDAIPAISCDPGLDDDQRAIARPQGDGCDIGAVEVVPAPKYCDGQVVTVDLGEGDVPTAGPDVILGTPAADDVDGLGGADRFCGQGGADTFDGGAGADRAFGGLGTDILRGGGGDDRLDGGRANDRVHGQIGRDVVRGGAGFDVLTGAAGNDALNGGLHRDTCTGGNGRDTSALCEVRSSIP